MREYFGWRKNSDMPEVYVHLSMRNVNEALLKHYGIKVEAAKEDTLTPKVCPWCKTMNSPSARFCQSCNVPLDPVSATKAAESQKQKFQFVMDVFSDLAKGASLEDALRDRRKELQALVG